MLAKGDPNESESIYCQYTGHMASNGSVTLKGLSSSLKEFTLKIHGWSWTLPNQFVTIVIHFNKTYLLYLYINTFVHILLNHMCDLCVCGDIFY